MNAGWTWERRPFRGGRFLSGRRLGGRRVLRRSDPVARHGADRPGARRGARRHGRTHTRASHGSASGRCGDTVRRDTTLTADLSRCRGNGLILGADGITLNLNGHTISGNGGGSGIIVTGRRAVHITGSGLFHRLETAVLLKNTTGSQVGQITVEDNLFGVTMEGGSADTVFHMNFEAIRFLGGDRHLALLNTVSDKGADASGVALDHTPRARMVHNDISGMEFAGIWVDEADGNVVEAKRMTDTGRGVLVFRGSRNHISYAHIAAGPKWPSADGIALFSGTSNRTDRNVIEAVTKDGITLPSFPPKGPAATDTVSEATSHYAPAVPASR